MQPYDTRRLMLDPGLTALALRGLHHRDGHYPFIDRVTGRRRARRSAPPAGRGWWRSIAWRLPRQRSAAPA